MYNSMAGDVEIPNTNSSNGNTSQAQNDRTLSNKKNDAQRYEENARGNERHILFHFFTLFSISFVSGIILIHLSLWMNSYMQSVFSPQPFREDLVEDAFITEQGLDLNAVGDDEAWYSPIYTQDERIKELLKSPFYYTGNYFGSAAVNATSYTQRNFSSNFAIK